MLHEKSDFYYVWHVPRFITANVREVYSSPWCLWRFDISTFGSQQLGTTRAPWYWPQVQSSWLPWRHWIQLRGSPAPLEDLTWHAGTPTTTLSQNRFGLSPWELVRSTRVGACHEVQASRITMDTRLTRASRLPCARQEVERLHPGAATRGRAAVLAVADQEVRLGACRGYPYGPGLIRRKVTNTGCSASDKASQP